MSQSSLLERQKPPAVLKQAFSALVGTFSSAQDLRGYGHVGAKVSVGKRVGAMVGSSEQQAHDAGPNAL